MDKGLPPEMEEAPFSFHPIVNAAWYIDGFNLYHAIAGLQRPMLKWLDVGSLAKSYLRPRHHLIGINFFTALNTWDAEKRRRHVNYITALESRGVIVHKAGFANVQKYCRKNEIYCKFKEEKQSDVGLAIRALADGYVNSVREFFFITADSDQIPTFQQIKASFPEAKIFLIVPPGRHGEARDLAQRAHHVFDLSPGRLTDHLLPASIVDGVGKTIAVRPSHYQPHLPA